MAKANQIPINLPDPLITLTDEARKHIENLEGEIARVQGDLEAMKEVGLDTTRPQEILDWSKKVRQILLDRL